MSWQCGVKILPLKNTNACWAGYPLLCTSCLCGVQVDILNTDSHNQRLLEAKKLLDAELTDKENAIAKYELEMKRQADEIERKTREIDQLNRKIEKIISSRPGELEEQQRGLSLLLGMPCLCSTLAILRQAGW
jgi:peptidoglycan hydrolase CwlO-like protein